MVRLILFLVLILFVIWILRPFLKTKDGKNSHELGKILNSDRVDFGQPKTIYIIMSVAFLLALLLWLLPRFGINLLSLFQKLIPLISTLRGILPF